MFEDLLLEPMENLPFYTFLLKQLCGKNRWRYAQYVNKMMNLQKVKMEVGPGFGCILREEEYLKN